MIELMQELQLSVHLGRPHLYGPTEEDRQKQWACLREEVLRRDDWKCFFCGFQAWKFQCVASVAQDPGLSGPGSLATVCQLCHKILHVGRQMTEKSVELWELPGISQVEIVRYSRDAVRKDQRDMWRTALVLAGTPVEDEQGTPGPTWSALMNLAATLAGSQNAVPAYAKNWRLIFTDFFPTDMYQLAWEGKRELLFDWQGTKR
jgi:hypothetical protein